MERYKERQRRYEEEEYEGIERNGLRMDESNMEKLKDR